MLQHLNRAIRHEFWTKLISVLLACALWVYVINTENPVRTDSGLHDVRVINVPSGLHLTRVSHPQVRVELTGRVSELGRGQVQGVHVIVDAAQTHSGANTVTVQVTGIPTGVHASDPVPLTVEIRLERRSAQERVVVPVAEGKPAAGTEIGGPLVAEPSRARLIGAAEALGQVATIVARVRVSGLRASAQVQARLTALDSRGGPVEGVMVQPSEVTVRVPIARLVTRKLPVRARFSDPPAGYFVSMTEVRPDSVEVRGSERALHNLREIPTRKLDLSHRDASGTFIAKLALPPGVTAMGSAEVSVRVVIAARAGQEAGAGGPSSASGGTGAQPETTAPAGAGPRGAGTQAPPAGSPGSAGSAPPTTGSGPGGGPHGGGQSTPEEVRNSRASHGAGRQPQ